MYFTCAFLQQLLIDHLRTNTRTFCLTVIGTLHKQTDSTLHQLNILDILKTNVYRHNALKFLHLWHKGLPKGIHSKIIFIMQAVFMDTTPDMLPTNLCKPWVCNNSGKPTIAQKMKADLDEIIENLDKGTWKSSLKVPLWNQKCQRPHKQKWKSFDENKACFSEHGTPYADQYVLPSCKISIETWQLFSPLTLHLTYFLVF